MHAIEFINCRGAIQKISKTEHPGLLGSANSNLGLLGITVFITLELDPLEIVHMTPR